MKIIYESDSRITSKSYKDIIKVPKIIYVSEFNEESVTGFYKDMQEAHNSGQDFIPIVIDSYGGYADSLISMVTEVENSEKPVITIVPSYAMSCGSILFSCGSQRFVSPNARIMIHEISGWAWGKNEEIKADAKETDRYNKFIFGKMSKNCGHKPDYFLKEMKKRTNLDWYLTARQALRQNLATNIGTPDMAVKISVDFELK